MNPVSAILFGIIQGLTEFLPISSSAHLQIAKQVFGLADMTQAHWTAFVATIQLGTEAAVLIYFFKDIVRIVKAWFASLFKGKAAITPDAKLGWLIIIGSLPVVIVGIIFKHQIENNLRNLWVVGVTLVVFGIILGWADRVGKKDKGIDALTAKHGVLYGLGQALSVIPGVSRSGATISVGRLLGYSRAAAARYSFLLAIPAVLASGVLEFVTTYKDLAPEDLLATAIATVVSFGVGFAVIVGLLRYLNRGSFLPFVIWRIVIGVLVLVGLSTGYLQAWS